VVVLGSRRRPAVEPALDLTQAFNSLGAYHRPKIGGDCSYQCSAAGSGQLFVSSAASLQSYALQEAASVKMPINVIGRLALILRDGMIGASKLPKNRNARGRRESKEDDLEASEPHARAIAFRVRRRGGFHREASW